MVTINDVAKKANVAKSTVSNFFSKKKEISKELKEKILQAAEELNYRPNYFASTLATKKSQVIGVSFNTDTKSSTDFHQNIIRGILSVCDERNYYLLINPSGKQKKHFFPIDGEIILNPESHEAVSDRRMDEQIKRVWVGTPPDTEIKNVYHVDNDNVHIGYIVTDFLIENGAANLCFLNSQASRTYSLERKRGFERAIHKHHYLDTQYRHYFLEEKADPQTFAYEIAKKELDCLDVQAFITDSDIMAKGVYHAAYERGKSIPDDLSVIAICSGLNSSEVFQPPLTVVELNELRLGHEAAQLLIDLIENVDSKRLHNKRIDSVLKIMGSTKIIQTS
ncbi:LacI family transcriptional regulator [Sporolactobacillus shoreicorticis]|uniref:LacI family DNA-binding transcriptional regulator n=1 Tax=Sporolactobacillus shoreicorticis TaxID=1923877 RepID=A0ABW5S4B8_9BACL|nr:LacI family DNA-binding transcriptional regulator [Sporolactobacillus shoreicorticis]MCO7124239.1 LacI family transcriptional regulator [Sporolactobacillus shoreicorticis]